MTGAAGCTAAGTVGSAAADRRDRILRAAWDLFAEQGYDSTSIRDIAEAAGITATALCGHFTAKREMLDALLAPLLDGLDAITETAAGQRPVDREGALRAFVIVVSTAAPTVALLAEPATLHGTTLQLDGEGRLAQLARALAGADDPRAVLAVRCALDAARSGLAAALRWRFEDEHAGRFRSGPVAAGPPMLTGDQIDLVVQAGLRAWRAIDPAPTTTASGALVDRAAPRRAHSGSVPGVII
jgi:AcrR family transcriptional regulator